MMNTAISQRLARTAVCTSLLLLTFAACTEAPVTEPVEDGFLPLPPPATTLQSAVLSAQSDRELVVVACAEVRADGVTATPLWIAQDEVETSGVRDWTTLDSHIATLRNCGLEIGLHLQSRRPWLHTQQPPDAALFASFAAELAARYRGQIRSYSIENEANAEIMWPYAPALYFEQLRAVRAAIKAADPSAHVQHSGVSSGGVQWAMVADHHAAGRRDEALELAQRVLVNGIGSGVVEEFTQADLEAALATPMIQRPVEWMRLELEHEDLTDAFQLHYYGNAEGLADMMRWLRDRGFTKPFEAWELAKRYGHQPYDDAMHTAEVAKLLVTAAGEGSEWSIFVRFLDWPEKYLPGLVDLSGATMPGRAAYRTTAAQLSGATAAEPLEIGDDVTGYRFATPRGEVQVVWTNGGTVTVALPIRAGSVRVANLDGSTTVTDRRTVNVGVAPVFVTATP